MKDQVDEIRSLMDGGRELVIMCGSAISGVSAPYVPMINVFSSFLFEMIADLLKDGNPLERTVALYSKGLLERGEFEGVRYKTKFEELVEIVQRVTSKARTDELMRIMYLCSKSEVGPNHHSIAYLLEQNGVKGCITSNFDNAIEQCFNTNMVVNKTIYDQTSAVYDREVFFHKIHGDVERNEYINTNSSMLDALKSKIHEPIKELLAGTLVLAVGYSGVGDFDILPILRSSEACLAWGVFPRNGPEQDGPEWAEHVWSCDLADCTSDENLLVALAESFGWSYHEEPEVNHDWQSGFREWCRALSSEECIEIVTGIFKGKNEGPVLNICLARHWLDHGLEIEPQGLAAAIAFINAGYYQRGLALLRSVDETLDNRFSIARNRGFALWRKGSIWAGIRELKCFLDAPPDSEEYEDGLRHYLEASLELITACRLMPFRRRLARILEVERGIKSLMKNRTNIQSYFLGEFTCDWIRWSLSKELLDAKISLEVQQAFDRFIELQMHAEAAVVARSAAQLDLESAKNLLNASCSDLGSSGVPITHLRNRIMLDLIEYKLVWRGIAIAIPIFPSRSAYWVVEGRHRRWLQAEWHNRKFKTSLAEWKDNFITL